MKTLFLSLMILLLGTARIAQAHCDTMNGPVVKAAQKALETGNVNLVLIWVQKNDEAEIRAAFEKTMAVRQLSPKAKELADMYFFETLVRIHRAGEGAPYTGLKPADTPVDSGIEAADEAVEKKNDSEVVVHLTKELQAGVQRYFTEVVETMNYKPDDVEAGRRYVKAYVTFIHYVEAIFQTMKTAGEHSHESHEAK